MSDEKKTNAHELTGQVFGSLTVLKRAEYQRKNGGVWWTCRCSCGESYDVPGTLLVTGRRTRCGGKAHEKNYAYADITGQKFSRLTALYPTDKRGSGGTMIWHCRCDCGNELDVPYNWLLYTHMKSCGCQKKDNDRKLHTRLTHVSGTSLEMLKSKKIPSNNTTGVRGVYLIKGKYVAKITFQKKQYFLGKYDDLNDAAQARLDAEEQLNDAVVEYYAAWKAKADSDPVWAKENPVRITVDKDAQGRFHLCFFPVLNLDDASACHQNMEEHSENRSLITAM